MKSKKKRSLCPNDNAAPMLSVSSDDDDDLPVAMINGFKRGNTNSYSILYKPSVEKCDFCEKEFKNRYLHLVHNAKHIIIPLLKQTLQQCSECLHHFTSQDDLNTHIANKHPETAPELHAVKTECRVKVEPMWVDGEVLLNHKIKPTEYLTLDSDDDEPELQQSMVERQTKVEYKETMNFKSKIVFEDDIISLSPNGLLNDLTTDCKVSVEMFDAPWLCDDKMYQGDMDFKGFEQNGESEETGTSVHYDDLVVDGHYPCTFCGKVYPNRLCLIQHEPQHMRFKRPRPLLCPYCDFYVCGNHVSLNRHIRETHPNAHHQRCPRKTCQICGLQYQSYVRHEVNYHRSYRCTLCPRQFHYESSRDEHFLEHANDRTLHHQFWTTKVLKVCEVCFSHFKSKQNIHYVHLRDINEVGARQVCGKCGSKFCEVKLLKILTPRENYSADRPRKRPLSNTDRLKNIQHRLKWLNTLNKY